MRDDKDTIQHNAWNDCCSLDKDEIGSKMNNNIVTVVTSSEWGGASIIDLYFSLQASRLAADIEPLADTFIRIVISVFLISHDLMVCSGPGVRLPDSLRYTPVFSVVTLS